LLLAVHLISNVLNLFHKFSTGQGTKKVAV
jgi:hypothetical protein